VQPPDAPPKSPQGAACSSQRRRHPLPCLRLLMAASVAPRPRPPEPRFCRGRSPEMRPMLLPQALSSRLELSLCSSIPTSRHT
jgi:hypothetical protein